jgi:hypothetical protein
MCIQNNNIAPSTTQHYMWHPVTKNIYPQPLIQFCDVQEILSLTDDLYFPSHRKNYNPLLSQCLRCPINLILPINLIYTLLILWPLSWYWHIWSPPVPSAESHAHFPVLTLFQRISPSPRLCEMVYNMLCFYGKDLLAPCQPPTGRPPLVGCLWVLFQNINS